MNAYDKLKTTATQVADKSDCDIYLYNGKITHDALFRITRVAPVDKRKSARLILTTNGGNPDAAYKLARYFQDYYEGGFDVVIPGVCKSAGTLVILGAKKIFVSMYSELGPLDLQFVPKNELLNRSSALEAQTALKVLRRETFSQLEEMTLALIARSDGQISLKMATDTAVATTTAVMAELYKQLPPSELSTQERDLNIAKEYGTRLVKRSKICSEETINKLVQEYPSHGFVIDASEIRELFHNVDYIDSATGQVVKDMGSSAIIPRADKEPFVDLLSNESIAIVKQEGEQQANDDQPTPESKDVQKLSA